MTAFDPAAEPLRAARVRQGQHLHTTLDWEVYPPALTDVLMWVHNRYGSIPLYITENGAAFDDPPAVEGPILDDPLRVAYLRDHLRAAHEAMRQGVDLRGYFVWSLMDNFEWRRGVLQAVWSVPREFRDPAPHPQGERPVLLRRDRYPRGDVGALNQDPVDGW